jgi:hypothetical protein
MAEIKVGKPDVKITKSTHVPGVHTGNHVGSYEEEDGHLPDGRSTSRRSTGINPKARNPVSPDMPNLSPA